MRGSELDKIKGIGPKRRADLLRHFKSISKIREAEEAQLREVLSKDAAEAVYRYFHTGA